MTTMSKQNADDKQNEIWFNDDVWGIIKEFAGIYNITTEWDKVLTKKVGLTKLHKCGRRGTPCCRPGRPKRGFRR